jgi:hypothetical protein
MAKTSVHIDGDSLPPSVSRLVGWVRPWHLALGLVAGLIAFGVGIGRFETKSAAQEKMVEHIERETKGDVKDFKDEVIRHLDELSKEQRATSRRIDEGENVLRDLSSNVAILCSRQAKGCKQ